MREPNGLHEIHALPVLQDNIIWIWVIGNQAVVVDPAVTEPVREWLEAKHFQLIAVLQTHHHEDHIGGTKGLIRQWPQAEIVASSQDLRRIPFQTISVKDGDEIVLAGEPIKVFEVPGHTKTHLAYYLPPQTIANSSPVLFCGDTLFGAGCGRLFEGTAQEMYKSLKLFKGLPDETKVYCAHEYTEANLLWAQEISPNNRSIKSRYKKIRELRSEGKPSLPSSILEEKHTNLFLRASSPEELAVLRKNKDNWQSNTKSIPIQI